MKNVQCSVIILDYIYDDFILIRSQATRGIQTQWIIFFIVEDGSTKLLSYILYSLIMFLIVIVICMAVKIKKLQKGNFNLLFFTSSLNQMYQWQ